MIFTTFVRLRTDKNLIFTNFVGVKTDKNLIFTTFVRVRLTKNGRRASVFLIRNSELGIRN